MLWILWTTIIKSKVFTNVQKKGRERLLKSYPNITFTTSDRVSSAPRFPTVFIKKMQGAAKGYTLEDSAVNAIQSVFQIEVTTNTNQDDAEKVADVIADIMISMGYNMIGEPFPDNTSDVYRNISRWQRLIGYNDILNF